MATNAVEEDDPNKDETSEQTKDTEDEVVEA